MQSKDLLATVIGLCSLFSSQYLLAAEDSISNQSNNPLHLAPGLNLQDYYTSSIYGSDSYTNSVLLRGTLPLAPTEWIGVPQLFRATLPVSTAPDTQNNYRSGLGDLNVFDIFLVKTEGVQIGIGPQITAPTASHDELGTSRWQAGLSAVVIDPSPHGLFGALVQYQHSFAGGSERSNVETATFQPFVMVNLPEGWYLRSTAIWNFDLENSRHYIPLGFGFGRASKMGNNIYNFFIEPQWTVNHSGDYQPQMTWFGGINITL